MYGNSPAVSKVADTVSPGAAVPALKPPVEVPTIRCGAASALAQVTVVPTATVRLCGVNVKSAIATVAPPAGSVAVGSAVVAGVAVAVVVWVAVAAGLLVAVAVGAAAVGVAVSSSLQADPRAAARATRARGITVKRRSIVRIPPASFVDHTNDGRRGIGG
jgi:hypothetical protein